MLLLIPILMELSEYLIMYTPDLQSDFLLILFAV
jgi:hypothetical protein